jgi:hypothetical protein
MGPGGVMALDRKGRRSSLSTAVAESLDRIRWPQLWAVGHGQSGPDDAKFPGDVSARYRSDPG